MKDLRKEFRKNVKRTVFLDGTPFPIKRKEFNLSEEICKLLLELDKDSREYSLLCSTLNEIQQAGEKLAGSDNLHYRKSEGKE